MKLTYIISIFIVLCALYFLTSCIKEDKKGDEEIINYVQVGDKVPYFSVDNGSGTLFTSDNFEGKKSLLFLFHTGCEDCQRELPKIDTVWQNIQNQPDIQIITIARQESKTSIDNYWSKEGFFMPFYLDTDRTVFNLFANSTIPRLYFINSYGIVDEFYIETIPLTAGQIEDKLITLP